MSQLETIDPFSLETVTFELSSAPALQIQGTITLMNPTEAIGPYLERIHEAIVADKLPEFKVDVTQLTFVNSSAIRLFADWVIRVEDGGKPYVLVFATDNSRSWQRTAFRSIASLCDDCIRILP
jgi:hypothetical protein